MGTCYIFLATKTRMRDPSCIDVRVVRGVKNTPLLTTRWAPTSYKWGYNSYKQGCNSPSYPIYFRPFIEGTCHSIYQAQKLSALDAEASDARVGGASWGFWGLNHRGFCLGHFGGVCNMFVLLGWCGWCNYTLLKEE